MGMGIVLPGDEEEYPINVKSDIAFALSELVDKETLPDLIELVKDRSHGDYRILLLAPLKRRRNKDPEIKKLLEELVNDPDLKPEISSWKKLS